MKLSQMGVAIVAAVVAAVGWGVPARAAVFVAVNPTAPSPTNSPRIVQFTDAGQPAPSPDLLSEGFAGLALDGQGTLYGVPTALGLGQLVSFDAATGAYRRTLVSGGVTSQYGSPGGIAVGPDGKVYATNNRSGFATASFNGLFRVDPPAGASFQTVIVLPPTDGFDRSALDVAFGPNGLAYVSTAAAGILRSGSSPAGTTFIAPGSGGLANPQGVAFGPDGNLYVANAGTNSVLRFDGRTGALVDTFVPAGAGGLGRPYDLAFDPAGRLLVASGTDSILRFTAAGAPDGVFATVPGTQIYTLTAGPVPEPGTASLAAPALAAALLRRRRR